MIINQTKTFHSKPKRWTSWWCQIKSRGIIQGSLGFMITRICTKFHFSQTQREKSVRYKPRYKQIPYFCLINISVARSPACCDDVNIHIPLRCWKSPELIELGLWARGESADQRRSCILITEDIKSVLIAWVTPVSVRCVAHFQESLNNHDKIILRSSLQPCPTCNLQCPLLNSVPPCSHITKRLTVQLRLIDMFQEKRCAMMMPILGTLNPYQMAGRELIWP